MSEIFDKFTLIKEYLLDKRVGPEIRKERFSIAWDIHESFEDIKIFMKREVVSKLIEKIKEKFPGFDFIDEGFSFGNQHVPFKLYKNDWEIYGQIFLTFAIEANQNKFCHFYFGIRKGEQKTGRKYPKEFEDISQKISEALKKTGSGWKTDEEWWIAWKYFRDPYGGAWKKEYFLEISEKGPEYVADRYLEEFIVLKKVENIVDECVKEYKALISKNA